MSEKLQTSKTRKDLSIPLLDLYIMMLRIRKLEEKIADLLNLPSEIICPVHLYTGQEAVATGVCANLKQSDLVFSTHRSHGHYIAKGGDMKALIAELYGRQTGCSYGHGGSMHLARIDIGLPGSSAIVAGTIPLAVGAALSISLRCGSEVSISFFGDGATNEGIFYESLNIACLKKLPIIFICENNLYSTHLHISKCLGDPDISKKAEAFGIPAHRIDGNNVVAVYETSKKAVQDTRQGKGPVFIECMTYRWHGHVGPYDDLDKGLRSKAELESWINKCPIKRLEEVLEHRQLLHGDDKKQIIDSIDKEIDEAISFAKNSPYPGNNNPFGNVFRG